MTRSFSYCAIGLALVGAQLPLAAAQTPSESGDAARSRVEQLLARGIQSRESGRDAEALEFYRQAAVLEPESPRVLAHLGATYHALGRWVSAHTYLTRALGYREDAYIQRHQSDLEDALAKVGEHIGFLEVYGAPDGAEALINGQLVATLPMSGPVPVIVGSYMLEVRSEGHYTLGRPINVAKQVLTREAVELAPHRPGSMQPKRDASLAAPAAEPEPLRDESSGAHWVPWAFGGLSAAATVAGLVAWERREHYADRWNDDDACLGVGISREERCGGELDRGKRAERVAWVSGAAAGVFAAGAVISAILYSSGEEPEQVGGLRCAPGWGGAECFGSF